MKTQYLSILSALCVSSTIGVCPAAEDDGVTLTVEVTNIPGVKGDLLIGLFDSAETFTVTPLPQSPKVPIVSVDPVKAEIKNLKPGTYAVVVIHDLNSNGKLDKVFGMPKEPLAFSNDPVIPRGVPAFDACTFVVADKDLSIVIPLKLK
jgi:uncharacterized protein (DUF2141 family)